jgi:Rrf2 family protein
MKYSSKCIYGLKALLVLADAYAQRAVSAAQISNAEKISLPYLEQILHRLKKRHWIKSVRGPAGGYVLARNPSHASIKEIMDDLEGKFLVSRKKSNTLDKSTRVAGLASSIFWEKLTLSVNSLLKETTLKSLLDEARSSRGKAHHTFSI